MELASFGPTERKVAERQPSSASPMGNCALSLRSAGVSRKEAEGAKNVSGVLQIWPGRIGSRMRTNRHVSQEELPRGPEDGGSTASVDRFRSSRRLEMVSSKLDSAVASAAVSGLSVGYAVRTEISLAAHGYHASSAVSIPAMSAPARISPIQARAGTDALERGGGEPECAGSWRLRFQQSAGQYPSGVGREISDLPEDSPGRATSNASAIVNRASRSSTC
jgi:hypothetical protein